jgi:hypothetical protein
MIVASYLTDKNSNLGIAYARVEVELIKVHIAATEMNVSAAEIIFANHATATLKVEELIWGVPCIEISLRFFEPQISSGAFPILSVFSLNSHTTRQCLRALDAGLHRHRMKGFVAAQHLPVRAHDLRQVSFDEYRSASCRWPKLSFASNTRFYSRKFRFDCSCPAAEGKAVP